MSDEGGGGPLPAKFIEPWISDNAAFIEALTARNSQLTSQVPGLRDKMVTEGRILLAKQAAPSSLAAVDAAVVMVDLLDQVSVLIQAVHVDDAGNTTLGLPIRSTGVNGHQTRLSATPMRVAEECIELAKASTPTIADTSYWSFLMEVNQTITRAEHSDVAEVKRAVRTLVNEAAFLNMLRNPMVIPMSKGSQSDQLIQGVSDREVYGRVLREGEYVQPFTLREGIKASFGVEKRGFTDAERKEVQDFYETRLGVLFFKPHPWTRAYRVEGRLDHLKDDNWLMPVLAAISKHTATRTIVEPWPQFIADYTSKQLSAVAALYGRLNSHRLPPSVPIRT